VPTANPSNKIIVLAGPTGVGKSLFAALLASRVRGEIVCGDAFQLYSGLQVLTAQPDATLLDLAPHHLYGSIPVSENYDAARYARLARRICEEIRARGNVPIVVGGSGFYLRALVRGFHDFPPPDAALRSELSKLDTDELVRRLLALDPAAAAGNLDLKNPRRVQRALEITIQTGRTWSQWQKEPLPSPIPHTGIVLDRPALELDTRIRKNVHQLWKNGAIEEVRTLLAVEPEALSRTAVRAIGFAEIRDFLEGRCSSKEAVEKIILATRQYAKRQRTWFRSQTPDFLRIDPGQISLEQAVGMLFSE